LADAHTAAAPTVTEPDWLTERREAAKTLASDLALPTQKDKGWEFTDLSGLDFEDFSDGLARVEGLTRMEGGANGAGAEPVVLPLAEAASTHAELVSEHLGSLVPGADPFVARNASRWRDGVFIYVPSGVKLAVPLRLEIVGAAESESTWRALIVLGEGAEAEVWERYASEDEGLFNAVVEMVVGDAATLRYVCEQELSDQSWVFATQRAEIGRDANLEWTALGFGSARGKVRMETKLAGQGSSAKVTGAYAGAGTQHLDYDTTQEHVGAHTNSDLAFRGVLKDRATAVWRGMIKVDPGAQQTDAFQESRNLLLSHDAHADAIPGLEIEADDVRCTHAAAVAQMDPEQLYYLKARGLSESAAQRLVVEGFVGELVERAPAGPAREELAERLETRLGELLHAG
jgi:Fe-S cluster assembly protein SufD